jgi:proline dehydrogenase
MAEISRPPCLRVAALAFPYGFTRRTVGPVRAGASSTRRSRVLRQLLLSVSRSHRIRHVVETAPVSRSVVARFVAGTSAEEAVASTRTLVDRGLLGSMDHLGEDTLVLEQATATRDAYLRLLKLLGNEGLTGSVEVSVKLSAVGQALPGDGHAIALDNAHAICEAAHAAGTTVTLDMEDHTTTDSTLGILRELRADFPDTGAVLQAYLRRTEADCRDLAYAGSRVRLCKGAYKEPDSVAFQGRHDVDLAYVRALKVLMAGDGYPMLATHDPRLVAITGELARRTDRAKDSFEYQMLYGIRPHEQERLAAAGHRVRVYIPYGDEWYGYLVRRMAERPANLAFFLRSVATKG